MEAAFNLQEVQEFRKKSHLYLCQHMVPGLKVTNPNARPARFKPGDVIGLLTVVRELGSATRNDRDDKADRIYLLQCMCGKYAYRRNTQLFQAIHTKAEPMCRECLEEMGRGLYQDRYAARGVKYASQMFLWDTCYTDYAIDNMCRKTLEDLEEEFGPQVHEFQEMDPETGMSFRTYPIPYGGFTKSSQTPAQYWEERDRMWQDREHEARIKKQQREYYDSLCTPQKHTPDPFADQYRHDMLRRYGVPYCPDEALELQQDYVDAAAEERRARKRARTIKASKEIEVPAEYQDAFKAALDRMNCLLGTNK